VRKRGFWFLTATEVERGLFAPYGGPSMPETRRASMSSSAWWLTQGRRSAQTASSPTWTLTS
jgi:hypothetical protein